MRLQGRLVLVPGGHELESPGNEIAMSQRNIRRKNAYNELFLYVYQRTLRVIA